MKNLIGLIENSWTMACRQWLNILKTFLKYLEFYIVASWRRFRSNNWLTNYVPKAGCLQTGCLSKWSVLWLQNWSFQSCVILENIRTKDLSSRLEVLSKKVFLKILQNLQENNCTRVSFLIKLQATLIFSEHLWWLLLKGEQCNRMG